MTPVTFLVPADLVALPLLLGRCLGEDRIFRLAQRPGTASRGPFSKRMKGLEPSTFCMASRRSSQLSYIRARGDYRGASRGTVRER
jgi:hypothetical protein